MAQTIIVIVCVIKKKCPGKESYLLFELYTKYVYDPIILSQLLYLNQIWLF